MDELAKYLRALIQLQIQTVYSPDAPQKPEVILSRAGLSHAEIAAFLGKNVTAVSKSISRAK